MESSAVDSRVAPVFVPLTTRRFWRPCGVRHAAKPKDAAFSVMTDLTSIRIAEEAAAAELRAVGSPAGWATVGVMFEDRYFLLLRDAVRFPDGSLGTYIRIGSRNPDSAGVAILPLLEEKVVLVRHYRHATQSWHLEIPRGFLSVGMTCRLKGS